MVAGVRQKRVDDDQRLLHALGSAHLLGLGEVRPCERQTYMASGWSPASGRRISTAATIVGWAPRVDHSNREPRPVRGDRPPA